MLRLPGLVAWNLCSDQAAAEIRAKQRPGPDTRPHLRGKCILAIRAFFICEECIFSHDFLGGGNAASKQKSLSSTIRNTGTITKNGSPAIGRTGIHGKLLQAPKKKKRDHEIDVDTAENRCRLTTTTENGSSELSGSAPVSFSLRPMVRFPTSKQWRQYFLRVWFR